MPEEHQEEERVPIGQVFFDEIFLLCMLSLVLALVVYNVWGLMDLLSVPVLQP